MEIKDMIDRLESIEKTPSNGSIIFELANELFNASSRAQDKLGLIVSDINLALYYIIYETNYKKGLQFSLSCIEQSISIKNDYYLMKGYFYKAMIDVALQDNFEAVMCLLEAVKISRAIKYKKIEVLVHNIIGDVFFSLNNKRVAFDYYEEAKNDTIGNGFQKDFFYQKCLLDYIYTAINLREYDVIDRTIASAYKIFSDELLSPFIALKEIISLQKRLDYIEDSYVDDIYTIFLKVDDIKNKYTKLRIALLLQNYIFNTKDEILYKEYCDLLESYSCDITDSKYKKYIFMIKETLIGTGIKNTEFYDYSDALTKENDNYQNSLEKAIRKILNLNKVVLERDSEIEKNKMLMELSQTDSLTKLNNRRYAEDCIEEILKDVTKTAFAFIILDVDKFKEINDTFGHTAGDEALIFVSNILKQVFDTDSIISRLAGDEFIIMLYNLPTQFDLRKTVVLYKIDTLQQLLKDSPLDFLDGRCMSISLGVTLDGTSFESLYSNADVALYDSKYGGRGMYSIYPDVNMNEKD